MLAIDFETYLIDKEGLYPKPICMSYHDGETTGLIKGGDPNLELMLREHLSKDTIVAHNAAFECGVIYQWFPLLRSLLFKAIDEDRVFCTKVNDKIIDLCREKPLYKADLATLVNHYFNIDISSSKTADAWRLRYHELVDIPLNKWPKQAIDYAKDDSIWTYKLYHKQAKPNSTLSIKSEIYLNLMGSYGIIIDDTRVKQLETEIFAYLEPIYAILMKKGILTKVIGSKRLKCQVKILREHIKNTVKEPLFTPKKSIRIDGDALHYYLKVGNDDIIQNYLEVIKYDKILTAFISRLKGNNIIKSEYSSVMVT